MDKKTGDYGWLDPSGNFYEASWGEHQTWAEEQIKKMPLWEELSLKERIWADGMGDVLMRHGWVLLHNPSHGLAFPTKSRNGDIRRHRRIFFMDIISKGMSMNEPMQLWLSMRDN